MSFFDAPWHVILLLAVALLLFGSKRLPGAAKSLGESMNIFKKSYKEGSEEHPADGTVTQVTAVQQPPQQPSLPVPPVRSENATPQQISDLQRQLDELQRQSASGAATADAPRDPQSF